MLQNFRYIHIFKLIFFFCNEEYGGIQFASNSMGVAIRSEVKYSKGFSVVTIMNEEIRNQGCLIGGGTRF